MKTTIAVFALLAVACGGANKLGVGAACKADTDCGSNQRCLTQFKGGYCGLSGCAANADCPSGSSCVRESVTTDGGTTTQTFCFLICATKPDCNSNRTVDNEANCSSSAVFVDGGSKACIPPSGG